MAPQENKPARLPARGERFATTHWSMVVSAGVGRSPDAARALAALCENYWFPLYAFVRRAGYAAEDAQDLTQEFFARLLAKNYLAVADQQRGRFRSFLLGAMKHFLAKEERRQGAQKRGGRQPVLSLDFHSGENRYSLIEPVDNLTPERLYQRRWALALLDLVLDRLCEEFRAAGKLHLFDALKQFLAGGSGSAGVSGGCRGTGHERRVRESGGPPAAAAIPHAAQGGDRPDDRRSRGPGGRARGVAGRAEFGKNVNGRVTFSSIWVRNLSGYYPDEPLSLLAGGLDMTDPSRCPQCGAEVPGDAPQGLCPKCVLKAGFSTAGSSQMWSESAAASSVDDRFVPPTPEELAPHFPDLEILELVGRGGMGVVYKARQKRLDRLVALKILAPKIGQDPAFAERFVREARAMAMLNHPHIVAVYDFGQTPTLPSPSGRGAGGEGLLYYFLMEFVDGLNVRRLLDAGKLAPEEALAIVPQICDALQYAHDHGVVHRDIKPENVLVSKEGRVKIADFGIAKLVGPGKGQSPFAGTALRVLRTNGDCPLFRALDRRRPGHRHAPVHGPRADRAPAPGRSPGRYLFARRRFLPDAHGRVAHRPVRPALEEGANRRAA